MPFAVGDQAEYEPYPGYKERYPELDWPDDDPDDDDNVVERCGTLTGALQVVARTAQG